MKLSFIHPYWLILSLPFIYWLVKLYLKKSNLQKRFLPSFFILKKIKLDKIKQKKKFIPPLRFYIELVALLLLILGVSGLSYYNNKDRIALIIDNSFSSKTQFNSTNILADLIINNAEDIIHSNNNGLFTIFSSSPFKMVADKLSASKALDILKTIKPIDLSDDNFKKIPSLFLNGKFDKIYIVTDKKTSNYNAKSSLINIISVTKDNLSQLNNVAIVDIHLLPIENKGYGVQVVIGNYANSQQEVEVVLKEASSYFSFNTIQRKKIKPLPFKEEETLFYGIKKGKPYLIEIKSRLNNLIDDDYSYIYLADEKPVVGVVSDKTLREMKLNNLNEIKFAHYYPQDLNLAVKNKDLAGLIFYKTASVALPPLNSLYVLPPVDSNNGIFSGNLIKNSRVVWWNNKFEALQYLNLYGLEFKQVVTITANGFTPILKIKEGSIISYKINSPYRYLAIGFEIFPFEGDNNPFASTVFFNALKWLKLGSVPIGYYATGDFLHTKGNKVEFFSKGLLKTINVSNGQLFLSQSGFYNDGEKILAVNFFNRAESNLLNNEINSKRLQDIEKGALRIDNNKERVHRNNLFSILAGFFLILICLDLLVARSRNEA